MRTTESVVIDGYDLLAETERLAFPDRVLCGRALNRGTARVPSGGTPHGDYADVKATHRQRIFPNTIESSSPVIDLSWPTAGMFVASPAGVYLDLYQGVAQKLLDEHHPLFERTIRALVEHGLAFRREINTDDFELFGQELPGLHTPQDLAGLVNRLAAEAFPGRRAFRTFFSNSGAEAGEAALKLSQLHAYRRLLRRHGPQVLAAVMQQLGIAADPFYAPIDDVPVYEDYPFFVIGCDYAFHGRTLGVLNLTRSKGVHHLGYGKMRWVRHVPFNGRADDLTRQLDDRPLPAILAAPGGLLGVLREGRVPSELVAGFFTEVFQGEGGYRLAEKTWITAIAAACRERSILVGIDEVQSFGRTGELFACQHFDFEPDVLWTAKAAVLGLTVARADLADDCHLGWHSNTFGSGKLFDVNLSHATFEALTAYRDPLFENRSYLENSRIKGEYVRMKLAELSARHEDLFPEFSGLGGMWGLTVRHRAELIATGWKLGLKLLGCGSPAELSRLRIVLLADVLTREVDEMVAALDRVFAAVERNHPS